MLVGEWDVAFNFCGAMRVWLVTIFIEVSPSATEHIAVKVGAPFFVVPIALAPLALHGQFFIGSVPQAVDSFNHSRDMLGGIGGRARGETVDDLTAHPLIGIHAG